MNPRGPARVTHKDVARRAGVSVATVSYVINDGPKSVAPATRARVQAVIDELQYSPNALARGLRRQQSGTVGLLLPNITNSFYAEIAHELESYLHAHGYLVTLCDSGGLAEREARSVQTLRAMQVEGLVAIPVSEPGMLFGPLIQARVPLVLLEHDVPGVACINIDEFRGGELSTRHLISLGHRRIALLRQPPTSALSRRRQEGYQAALVAAGLPLDPALVIDCDSSHEAGFQAMRRLLNSGGPPTAVFTHNDLLAVGVCHAVREAGLSVPEDVSVVGYDDISSAAYLNPPLTTVRYPKAEMGRLAAEMLLALLNGETPTPGSVTLPVELVVRGSTAAPRILDL